MPDLQPLLPRRISQSVFPSIGDTPPVLPPIAEAAMGGGLQSLLPQAPAGPMPVLNPRISSLSSDPLTSRKDALEADLYNRTNPVKPTTTLGKIGHVAAGIGNVLGDIFAPATMALIPGTDLHNEGIEQRDKHDLASISQEQTAQGEREKTAAQTTLTEAQPALQRAKLLSTLTGKLAPKGFKPATFDENGDIQLEEDPDSQAFKNEVALQALHNGTAAYDAIKTENADQRYKPGTPQYTEWKQRLDNAAQANEIRLGALGLSRERLGFEQDKTYNPEPTAQERSKGDLAQSALDRVAEMKQIVAKHPEYFGPVAGRAQNAQAWIGSSDPDAVTYNTAAQYLADHSAGVFGGRGQYITQALHGITNPKYTPEGLNAALDEAQRAAQGFKDAGTTHAKGKQGAAAAAAEVIPEYTRVNGKLVKK